jgi:hypothetical protein
MTEYYREIRHESGVCENNGIVGLKLSSLTRRWGRLKPATKDVQKIRISK